MVAFPARRMHDVSVDEQAWSRLPEDRIEELRRYLSSIEEVAFAVLFGSAAAGRLTSESDVDIGVYLSPHTPGAFEIENPDGESAVEAEMWSRLERIIGRTVDLVVLNRAAAGVGAEAVRTGIVLSMRDARLFSRYGSEASDIAESFRDFIEDFVKVRARSRSLSEADKSRLLRILDFLESELADIAEYQIVARERYFADARFRRSIERWVENLANSSIDIAKIVIAASGLPMPQTYREALEETGTVSEFGLIASRLANNVGIRNALAHEYLDIRFKELHRFVEGADIYLALVASTRAWMGNRSAS